MPGCKTRNTPIQEEPQETPQQQDDPLNRLSTRLEANFDQRFSRIEQAVQKLAEAQLAVAEEAKSNERPHPEDEIVHDTHNKATRKPPAKKTPTRSVKLIEKSSAKPQNAQETQQSAIVQQTPEVTIRPTTTSAHLAAASGNVNNTETFSASVPSLTSKSIKNTTHDMDAWLLAAITHTPQFTPTLP